MTKSLQNLLQKDLNCKQNISRINPKITLLFKKQGELCSKLDKKRKKEVVQCIAH